MLIIWHLRRSVPKLEVPHLNRESFVSETHPRGMFKKASRIVCTSTIVVYPDYLSPAPSTSSVMKIKK
jgi:hypothetical protein